MRIHMLGRVHSFSFLIIPLLLLLLLILPNTVIAQEHGLESAPAPDSADQIVLPSTNSFNEPYPGARIVEDTGLTKSVDPFFRDTTLKVNLRSFYLDRESPPEISNRESLAYGGSVALRTGKFADVFDLGAEFFTSQKGHGPETQDGALLLEPGQEGYSTLGVLNPRFSLDKYRFSLYRQRHELPYVNSQDNRMTPNTFEGYHFGLPQDQSKDLAFGFGYFDSMKKRNSEDFVSMSEAAGVDGQERGMPWAGVRYAASEQLTLSAVNYSLLDTLNIAYFEAESNHKFSEATALKVSLQASEQRAIGDELLEDSSDSVSMWGAQSGYSINGLTFRAALTANDKGSTVRSPFGTYPGYNSSIVEDFNRAGEVAWRVGAAYDFKRLGLDGLSAYINYIEGNRAVDPETKEDLADKQEFDINIDYRISEGLLKNFWIRLRSAQIHEDGVGNTDEYRAIVNYEIPISCS